MTPFAALALCLAAQAEPADLSTRSGADWPEFLGPAQDGSSTERGLPATWPAGGPRLVWRRGVGEGYATCSVQRGRLFHVDRAEAKYRLHCLRAETGEPLWTFAYESDYEDGHGAGNGPRCMPVADLDRVYLLDPAGVLTCVRAVDGAVVWKKDTAAAYGVERNFFGVGSTPRVEGDLLLVHVGGSPDGSAVVAFDKRTGAERWKLGAELASYASPVIATIGGRRWGFVFARGGLIGFDPVAGRVDFHHPWRAASASTVNICSPVVAGDLVFVSEAYGMGSSVVRARPGGCDVVWQDGRKRDRALQSYWNTPVHVDGHLYGSNGMGGDADLRCVELATGKVAWTEPAVKQPSLLRVDGRLVALGEAGGLWLLDATPERCRIVSRAESGVAGPARSAPVLARGLLYVRGRDRLACFELIPQASPREREFDEAIRRATAAVEADPKSVDAFSRRGDALFFRGRFADAAADYGKMVELDPALDAGHWRRGIAYFYAGDFAKAARQFEVYHSHDDVDRENGIWRYFSQFRASGRESARAGLLKYAKDDREPFPGLYRLFEGKAEPDVILKAVEVAAVDDEEREKRRFYAHLYVGLNHAVEGRRDEALVHLRRAVANRWAPSAGYGPAYMWHVGRLHVELLSVSK